ncbi:MAG: F0F1 ATP synthase subunit A [Candidatus Moranbacteria bacterium]|nr:F0F1 ATP synthase subunit A [Candidatus Moranbacteria bacterium]
MGHDIHVSLKGGELFEIFGIPVTNTMITTWIVMGLILFVSYLLTRKVKLSPSRGQVAVEFVVGGLYDYFYNIFQDKKKTQRFFSLFASFFIFIIIANWMGTFIESIPGIHHFGITKESPSGEEFIPFLRSPNSDVASTVSWSLISVLLAQVVGISYLGVKKYLHKFFNFKNPIYFFIGIIELISEFSKIVSLSFRLFGNILAGEILLLAIGSVAPLLAPLPFYGLEIFVGFIQALVFTTLSVIYMKLASEVH